MKTYTLKATETSVFSKEFEIEADSFGEAMLKLETALDQEPLDSRKNTFQGMDREIVDLDAPKKGSYHQLKHPDLVNDYKSLDLPTLQYNGHGKTHSEPECWEIESVDKTELTWQYQYNNKIDYLNDCTILGINPNI